MRPPYATFGMPALKRSSGSNDAVSLSPSSKNVAFQMQAIGIRRPTPVTGTILICGLLNRVLVRNQSHDWISPFIVINSYCGLVGLHRRLMHRCSGCSLLPKTCRPVDPPNLLNSGPDHTLPRPREISVDPTGGPSSRTDGHWSLRPWRADVSAGSERPVRLGPFGEGTR